MLESGKLNDDAAAVHRTPLMATHPGCENKARRKLDLLVPFLCPNASLMIWASQMLVRQVPCHDSMRKSSNLKSIQFLAFLSDLRFLVQ